MKWVYMLMSFLVRRFAGGDDSKTSPIEEFKELVKENGVKIFLAIAAAAFLGTLFVSGISIISVNLAAQYDSTAGMRMTAVTTVGVVLLVLSILGFIGGYIFSTKHDREKKKLDLRKAKYNHKVETIHDAVLLLINDYIAEREYRREMRYREHHLSHGSPSESVTRH